ncbi:MAG: hypothetical protein GTO18_16165 [Anaerolineales bacterium]|nr:hypothetical protein [Anaerolineales bacterium]
MNKENLVALFHALAGAASLVASFATRGQLVIPEEPIKTIGFIIFGLGVLLFTYALFYLREAFGGNVQPVTEELITAGPYKFVRHPLYLAMLIMCLGLGIAMRSIWGLAIALLLFFPLCIYRAKLEEASLLDKFEEEWEDYAKGTKLIIPFVY